MPDTNRAPRMTQTPHPLEPVEDLAARSAEAMAEAIIAEAAISVYPRGDLEIRILETLRAYYPMPITPVQLAVMLGQPRERVLSFMQALATLGTIARPTRSYYQHIPLPQTEGGSYA
jgi:hypothetical protein